MKTKSAFNLSVAFALTSTLFVGSLASAQLSTTVKAKRKTHKASSTLVTQVQPPAPAKSPFSLELVGTGFSLPKSTNNFIETDLTAAYDFNENVSLHFDTGYESYFQAQQQNNAYDVEPSLVVSNIDVIPSVKTTLALITILPTSRAAHDTNRQLGFGVKAELNGNIGVVKLDWDNEFRQFTYKTNNDVVTPSNEDPIDKDSQDKIYTNDYTVGLTQLTAAIPIAGPFTFKSDVRLKDVTPIIGIDQKFLRFRNRISLKVNDNLGMALAMYYSKDLNSPTAASYFDNSNRAFTLTAVLDI